mmetsp:Transcript_14253/g.21325  ORF Transcript_14253/g.21325 Transcript_14253/m.21325 type:complete len:219 (+) Transcript_14253:88-744(+)|eukprot:CAMPEP_0201548554 /NCGR_PEP_ID=MMETSP0173_2-20130828/5098_1 /ASSEMBLY_ACC=CAM_ASM_000268 /TAXON_ID=218659 /ORGANISM="Vexillifera sp., Strain DIVA3 564/2" /LENGTH=218 /DNA_ID=CAMNT_0047957975 /DNA_START=71 /DNA_END=727 /DNA_ORIENTATION=+
MSSSSNINQEVIGIDFGGVISGGKAIDEEGNEDTRGFFGEHYLQVKAQPGAFEGVKFIVDCIGADNVYIVSKAGARTAARTLEWLKTHDFYKQTGFAQKNHILFCRERREKSELACSKKLTRFIDDHEQNLDFVSRGESAKFMRSTYFFVQDSVFKQLVTAQDIDAPRFRVSGWENFVEILKKHIDATPLTKHAPTKICRFGDQCKFGKEYCRYQHPD